ncbi:THAP domain-containing protein 5-like [Scomber japonicus]|uniref:THAP domain-containing protein 5-like n=1 Tax=Scomber japonicus TaxID=13676 RepID=UPI002304D441|nr:THAP domain-containing protein 5-like [Scomber japonicus]
MPKYCSAPNCKSDSGSGSDRRSFYKFPLQEPDRLQQWLRNMGRENWIPSRHQYICHEHFAPSCFKVRWGIRYLESDAVPTVFQKAEKRKATDLTEKKPKVLRANNSNQSVTVLDDRTVTNDAVDAESVLHTVHLYEITVDSAQQGETSPVESSDVEEPDRSLQTDMNHQWASVNGFNAGANFPLTLIQSVDDLSDNGENTEVVVMSECSAGESQEELMNGITAAILTQGQRLVMNDSTLGCTDATSLCVEDITYTTEDFSDILEGHETQVIAYFEKIPNVFPSETSQFTLSPETVLSSALSSKPITSTLPIVSKHVSPSPTSLVLTVERLDTEGEEGDSYCMPEEDGTERQDHQLEEHCYHKNSLSKEQLEAIVAELQKKVKVLQQRHRRHLEKLLGLENTVSQLRQNNLLNEERLQLLERAYIQTSAAVSDADETVAIIYEEDDGAYLYTPLLNEAEEML